MYKSLKGNIIKQVNDLKYLGSYVAFTDHDVNVRIGQAWVRTKQYDINMEI